MSRSPERTPAYALHCLEELIDVLCEADALARAGQLDGHFTKTLRYASDLLDILTEEVGQQPELQEASRRVNAASALLTISQTIH